MLAEIGAALAEFECVRALQQLDERNGRGETFDVIDGSALREHLTRQIDALPMAAARTKLHELQALLAAPSAPDCQRHAMPAGPAADVAPLPAITGAETHALVAAPGASRIPVESVHQAPEAAPTVSMPRHVPLRQSRHKPMHQRLAEAASVSTCIAIVATSILASALMPMQMGMKAQLVSAIEPAAYWIGMILSD